MVGLVFQTALYLWFSSWSQEEIKVIIVEVIMLIDCSVKVVVSTFSPDLGLETHHCLWYLGSITIWNYGMLKRFVKNVIFN